MMTNQKYEITNITHEQYPFLHRIRALRDIGKDVKAGDLGGFVESESNLSFEPGDDAWIFNDAICAGTGYVDMGSQLFDSAVVCARAYLSRCGTMRGHARAEDDAYIRGAVLCGHARASGSSMILSSPDGSAAPVLSDSCAVYGTVQGDVRVEGSALVFSGEQIRNDSLDTLVIHERGRYVLRAPSRDDLTPQQERPDKVPERKRGHER